MSALNPWRRLGAFGRAEDGAVTLDWVVLMALVVGVCLAIANMYREPVADVAAETSGVIEDYDINVALE